MNKTGKGRGLKAAITLKAWLVLQLAPAQSLATISLINELAAYLVSAWQQLSSCTYLTISWALSWSIYILSSWRER